MISVGLDVGGTKVLGVAVDERGTVLAEERRATVDSGPALLDDLAELYTTLAGQAAPGGSGAPPPLGVGVPGLVDPAGTLVFAPNLPGAGGTDVRSGLASRLSGTRPVIQVDNDATCAAAGESAFGAGAGRSDVLFVTVGTGIGGGIVAGGRLVRGSSNFAGEIGHIVVDAHGPPCGCGRRGCWERYASGSGLGRIARDAALAGKASRVVALAGGDADSVRGEHVMRAAEEGDEEAAVIVEEFAWWLALGLANLANVLDPRVVVIGGGLVRAGEVLLGPVRRSFFSQVEGASVRPLIEILPAALGDRGGAVGAAVIGFDAFGITVLGRTAIR
ncbi:MAG TPA: ROK family protein [Acidimicrobiales bacterium]|nr:ROK family protein [Acidimicrobiales bacterium]